VFIDLLGYRKYGHTEGDEPRFTQPKLYKAIAKHKNPRDIDAEKLIAENIIDTSFVSELEAQYKDSLEVKLEDSRKEEKTVITPFMQDEWEGFSLVNEVEMMNDINTSYPQDKLDKLAEIVTNLPSNKKFLRKI